ncbi:MAG TPA: DUF4157 domain-containing protein [Longimicrobium sp.]|nr:DUF4157 domain-containing protein [Longimicrobium sp.]
MTSAHASAVRAAPARVSAAPAAPVLRRACACGGTPGPTGECEECRRKRPGLRRSPSAAAPAVAPQAVHDVLRSPGTPLDGSVRAQMEPRFRHSFADVRVHADSRAAESARSVGAHAYAVGTHLVFGAGRYVPGSAGGNRLIAHELAHVVQQRGAPSSIQPELEIGAAEDPAEREADAAAAAVTAGGTAEVAPRRQPVVRRYGHDVKNCTDADLKELIWPGDQLAREWLAEAVATLGSSPLPAKVTRLFGCYFMTDSPNLPRIRENLGKLQARFAASDYFYTCDRTCPSTKERRTMGKTAVSPLFGGSGPIVLCVENIRKSIKPEWAAAETIIHEFFHRYLSFDDEGYCSNCCEGLSAAEALKNPDSYSGFVRDLHFELIKPKPKP